jgi:hypothetical protein
MVAGELTSERPENLRAMNISAVDKIAQKP